MQQSVIAGPTKIDVIDASGADAASYLQGQLSQDVVGLNVGETRWTLLLQPQGKVDAWMRIHRQGEQHFLLLIDAGFGEQALARLERFKLRVDVDLTLSTRAALALRGPGSNELAESLELDGAITVVGSEWSTAGLDLVVGEGVAQVPVELPDGTCVTSEAGLELVRMLDQRPAMGSELDESTIPAAAGVVDRSVDFTKGCYVGQELVARVDSRGNNTPTSLVGLEIAAPVEDLDPERVLSLQDSAIGRVTSAASGVQPAASVGLGYVKRGTEVPGHAEILLRDGTSAPVALLPLD